MTRAPARRAFTLIELLLAVFILAIGIISVTALFPAGIVQQQRAQDDQFGPLVAEAALGVLRNRVDAADFGTFEEHGQATVLQASCFRQSFVYRPTTGDWSWARPSLYRVSGGVAGRQPDGAIDIFGSGLLATGYPGQTGSYTHEFGNLGLGPVRGIPFNLARSPSPNQAPAFIVTQRERCWPMIAEGPAGDGVVPDYMWECMFRRSGGRIQVGIFVYRVVGQGGARRMWVSPTLLPVRRVVASTSGNGSTIAFAQAQQAIVAPGWTPGATPAFPGPFTSGTMGAAQGLTATDFQVNAIPQLWNQWQLPGQWVLDNNASVHRVLRGRLLGGASEAPEVRFSSPIPVPPVSESAGDYELELQGRPLIPGVRSFFFIPGIPDDGSTQLVPVYATVRDL